MPGGDDHVREVRRAQGRSDRFAPIKQSLLAQAVGEDFIAVHRAARPIRGRRRYESTVWT
jgi:hypothetical protein